MKIKKILKITLILILIGTCLFVWQKFKRKNLKERFKTITVEKGELKITVQATGSLMPQNRLEIKPPISGRIENIRVEEGQTVKKGEILAWISSTERAALLDAARSKGEKELIYWEDLYKPTPLISPMEGVIIVRNMQPGQSITIQDAPLVMSDRLIVKAQVDETDIGQLLLQQKVEIILDAYPNVKIKGKVNHIAYESKTVNNVTMYEVEVLPEKILDFMRSGMTANLKFIIQEKDNILIIPQEAVKTTDNQTTVFVPSTEEKNKKNKILKTIETGITDGKKIEILQGLSEGEPILVPEIRFQNFKEKNSGVNPFMPARRRSGSGGSGERK
ncbi:MAG: efflux RND transporter periplasmic adaptor subunit [Elusimicrobia bacterium]|nr:efflux RND transporter periplasmic adaptor subunit [Elusimicrobiota bacterium]